MVATGAKDAWRDEDAAARGGCGRGPGTWRLLGTLLLGTLFLAVLAVVAPLEARPPSEPWRRCQALLQGFELAPLDLASESHFGGPDEPSAIRLEWRRAVPGGRAEQGFLVCYFLPLAESGGVWQVQALDSDHFGRLERYDIQQLNKLIRQRFRGLKKADEGAAADPGTVGWLHAAQQGINALSLGALYGLIAVGFTLAFAASGVFNLAFGTIFTVGAFQSYLLWLVGERWLGEGWLLAVPAMLAMALLGGAAASVACERMVFRRISWHDRQASLVAAAGLLIVLQELLRLLQGPKTRWLPFHDGNTWMLADAPGFSLVVSRGHLIVLLATVALVLGLLWYLRRTVGGRSLRAVADDPQAAALLGVSVGRTVGGAFLLAGALAGVAGGFAFLHYGAVNPSIGLVTGFKALTAAILGGIGSVPGALLGGLVIAGVEATATALGYSAWKDVLVFAVLVAVLVLRPAGLLGRALESGPEGRLGRG